MAHAAEIASDGTVLRTIVIPDDVTDEQEFCAKTLGLGGTWKRTHKDRSARKNYAGPGFKYDSALDAFVPPRPRGEKGEEFLSWTVDPQTAQWKAPKSKPDEGHVWDETARDWVKVRVSASEPISLER